MTAALETPVTTAMDSERAVLAAAVYSPAAYIEATRLISDDEWYTPMHAEIWKAMDVVFGRLGAVDAIALSDELRNTGSRALSVLPNVLTVEPVASVSYHCERITEASNLRVLARAGTNLTQRATLGTEPVALAEDAIIELRTIQRMGAPLVETEIDFLDLVARPVDEEDFVIPNLPAPMNRLILTGPEGFGKSALIRQLATCTAAGVHPFEPRAAITPQRVLVIDAENPEEINTVEYQLLYRRLNALGRLPERGMLRVEESGPMNLLDSSQAARLYALVERIQPQLITIGPLYQLHEENPNDEGPARKLSAVLDRLRAISHAALIVEAHSPHSDGPNGHMMRPFGASLWRRWPEFGYCLLPENLPSDATDDEKYTAAQMRESKLAPWRGALPGPSGQWTARSIPGCGATVLRAGVGRRHGCRRACSGRTVDAVRCRDPCSALDRGQPSVGSVVAATAANACRGGDVLPCRGGIRQTPRGQPPGNCRGGWAWTGPQDRFTLRFQSMRHRGVRSGPIGSVQAQRDCPWYQPEGPQEGDAQGPAGYPGLP